MTRLKESPMVTSCRLISLALALALSLAGCERHREDPLPPGSDPLRGSQPEIHGSPGAGGAGSGGDERVHEGPSGGYIDPGPIITPEK
jgi:hypothetical protein